MSLSRRDMVLLAVLGAALLVGGTWWFVVKPANEDASATREQVEQVEAQISVTRDTLERLERDSQGEANRTAERLRLAKAIPASAAVPGAIVQLGRAADRSNVVLAGVKTNARVSYGALDGIELEVRVTGRFFDVDDFLFRVHRLVRVDGKDEPAVKGRLLAVTAVNMDLADEVNPNAAGSQLGPKDRVQAVLTVIAFSEGRGELAAPSTATPAAAPAEDSNAGGGDGGSGSDSEAQTDEGSTQ